MIVPFAVQSDRSSIALELIFRVISEERKREAKERENEEKREGVRAIPTIGWMFEKFFGSDSTES